MDVAILYSAGKDSTYAIDYCLEKDWNIKYLLSVKPNRKDCFLFHYATVEHSKKTAEILDKDHKILDCEVANPEKEGEIVKEEIKKRQKEDPVDAVVLGGTGLQETQLKTIQDKLHPMNIEVFAAHSGYDHDQIMKEMVENGYEFVISQVASQGLVDWLGETINKDNINELFKDASENGFHPGGEGGYFDTFVLKAPIFDKDLKIKEMEKIVEDDYCGHIIINELETIPKKEETINSKEIKN